MMKRMEKADGIDENRMALGELVQKRQAIWKQVNAASLRAADAIATLDKPSENRQKLQNDIDAALKMSAETLKKLK